MSETTRHYVYGRRCEDSVGFNETVFQAYTTALESRFTEANAQPNKG